MADRVKIVAGENTVTTIPFIPTGSTLLDLALGGGWPLGRIFNIVGDRSSGKTLLAIESFANFSRLFGGEMRYGEAESAFDTEYAKRLGFPNSVTRPGMDDDPLKTEKPLETVQEFYADLDKFCNLSNSPKLYILDSLDALSSNEEMSREMGTATFGAEKAKAMSEAFRRIVRKLERTHTTLGVISQIRDRIGVMFGEKHSRSGGKALDFYASEILWLAEVEKIKKVVLGQERILAVSVEGKVKKCKVANPFRKIRFDIVFGYGVDDEISMLDFLLSTKKISKEEYASYESSLLNGRKQGDYDALDEIHETLFAMTRTTWLDIEKSIAPTISKYR